MVSSAALRLARAVLMLSAAVLVFCFIALSYLLNRSLIQLGQDQSFRYTVNMFLILSIVLILIGDLIPENKIAYKNLLAFLSAVFISAYSLLGSLIDISNLEPRTYTYVPPMFIVMTYKHGSSNETLGSLAISVPLGVSFAILMYGMFELIKTLRAIRIKKLSKVESRFDIEKKHDVGSHGDNS